jgi:hypothetical protein
MDRKPERVEIDNGQKSGKDKGRSEESMHNLKNLTLINRINLVKVNIAANPSIKAC